jgi:Tfp pilus assembly protein PilO
MEQEDLDLKTIEEEWVKQEWDDKYQAAHVIASLVKEVKKLRKENKEIYQQLKRYKLKRFQY